MIISKTKEEIKEILNLFDSPKLFYDYKFDAGPDEEIYFLKDKSGKRYGIWSRDYMSELEYEANALKNIFNIEIDKWICTKNDDYVIEVDGDKFALFEMK